MSEQTIDKRDLFTIDAIIADVADSLQRDYHDGMHAMQRLEDGEADDDAVD